MKAYGPKTLPDSCPELDRPGSFGGQQKEVCETLLLFSALADALRTGEELCVCDVAHVLGVSISTASHHLRKLRDLKLLKYRNEGRMAYYSLRNELENQVYRWRSPLRQDVSHARSRTRSLKASKAPVLIVSPTGPISQTKACRRKVVLPRAFEFEPSPPTP